MINLLDYEKEKKENKENIYKMYFIYVNVSVISTIISTVMYCLHPKNTFRLKLNENEKKKCHCAFHYYSVRFSSQLTCWKS